MAVFPVKTSVVQKAVPLETAIQEINEEMSISKLKTKHTTSIAANATAAATPVNEIEKLSNTDLLIPSSIDEEEIMLKKALELSLKETNMSTLTSNTTKKVSSSNKLGLDDFNDDTTSIVSFKAKPTVSLTNNLIQNKNVSSIVVKNLPKPQVIGAKQQPTQNNNNNNKQSSIIKPSPSRHVANSHLKSVE